MGIIYSGNRTWSELSAVEKISICELAHERKYLFPDPYLDIPRHKKSYNVILKREYDRKRYQREKHIKKLCQMRGIKYET